MASKKTIAVAVMGLPNAGKSTLVNRLVGAKVSIATHKAQTTRNAIRGIAVSGDTQIILIDTPGILFKTKFKGQEKLHKEMMNSAWGGMQSAEIAILLVDSASRFSDENFKVIDKIKKDEVKSILVFNKVDNIEPHKLLELTKRFNDYHDFAATFMISASTGAGVSDLVEYLCREAKESPWIYGEDDITDASAKFIAAEATREQILLKFHEEIPYYVSIDTEKWEEDEKKITIHQVIYVARESQKKIIVGNKGGGIKEIGEKARGDLQKFFGKKVNLFLFVKCRDNWADLAIN